jgi:hypothetical protein
VFFVDGPPKVRPSRWVPEDRVPSWGVTEGGMSYIASVVGGLVQGAVCENFRGVWGRRYILISAASTMASAISRMDLRNFMLFC